jgi:hypothetical protein
MANKPYNKRETLEERKRLYILVLFFFLFCWYCRALLAGRHSTTLTLPPSVIFAQVIFEIGSHFWTGPAWIAIFLFMFSQVAGIIGVHYHAQLFPLRWGLMKFFPRTFFWNQNLPYFSLQCSWDDRGMPRHTAIS